MYLNLQPADHDRLVYRITSLPRLWELFEFRKNVLVRPRLWDDPYENLILRQKVRHKSGEIHEYNYHESIYGQCWTFHKASDAMWRIYAAGGEGVRIRTTIRTLAQGLRSTHPHVTDAHCRLGRVLYLPARALRDVANRTFDDYGIGTDELFSSLLVKRRAFTHERELRVLYFDWGASNGGNDLYSYEVDPHAMISQIMLDPRLPRNKAEAMKDEIRERTGFRGPILRSLLYSAPRPTVLEVSDWKM